MSRWHSPPAELYELVEHTPATVLLESARPAPADSEPGASPSPAPTRLFAEPLRVCAANRPAELPILFEEIERAVDAGLYAAGYFAYECGAFFEPSAAPANPSGQYAAEPLAWVGIYRQPHLFDHQTGVFLEGDPPGLAQFGGVRDLAPPAGQAVDSMLALTEQQYAQRIAAIHEWIRAGDVYQLNFTLPLRVRAHGSSAALYRRLRSLQPAPYGAFLHTQPNRRILSFSPELFFRLENHGPHESPAPHPCVVLPSQVWESPQLRYPSRRITTRPMKGTAPRGRTTSEDRALANWLRNDPKNRAENVMIVDLLRNDLGRLCTFGSVRAGNLFAVERYPTLWQMTSTITGELRAEVNFQQIFRALFPCGSITGAPKIRAMQLIAQLEQQPRGVYTGAIGFFSREESVFNVPIRTLTLDGEAGTMGVGGGIVIDSKAADEWSECLLKAEFLTRSAKSPAHPSPDSFSLVETLLWRGEYPLIQFHLDRLEGSAHYFGFPFSRAETRTALETHAESFAADPPPTPFAPFLPLLSGPRVGNPPASPPRPAPDPANSPTCYSRSAGANSPLLSHKVRLLLSPDGTIQITSEPLPEPSTQPQRLRIATERTDPQDAMYFHKTTHRPLYAQAFPAAIESGHEDVLFLNQRNEVTEAAIHNIFIEKNGRLQTPPIDCGLLPGVHRRHVLATHPNAEERVLTIDDLRSADAVYLTNAVRGLRQAIIDWEAG
jgi:para-aminobenzoate synthetase/4-amino-4-deoxychorismate lyase